MHQDHEFKNLLHPEEFYSELVSRNILNKMESLKKKRHILSTVKTLMMSSHMPLTYWVEATSTVFLLINRLPSSRLANTSRIVAYFMFSGVYVLFIVPHMSAPY